MTANPNTPMPLDHLVRQAALLDEELRAKGETLRGLKNQIAAAAEYKPGSKTGAVLTSHYKVKVVQRENVSWDQARLNEARAVMGDSEFFRVFKWDFEPVSAKALAGALEFGQHAELIAAARSVKPGQAQVSFELLGE